MSMPPTAVLSGLMIIVSFLLAHSDVQVEGQLWKEPVILWVSIVMPTGSGKSSLFAYFLTLLRKVRGKCNRKDIYPSWTVEESSFENMGALMSYNEARSFLQIQVMVHLVSHDHCHLVVTVFNKSTGKYTLYNYMLHDLNNLTDPRIYWSWAVCTLHMDAGLLEN